MNAIPAPILMMENVTVDFDGFKALTDVSLSLTPGTLRILIGPNGAGKSTLCDTIIGRVRPTSGRITFKDENITALAEQEIVRRGICRKFQTPGVLPTLTVFENLLVAGRKNRAWYRSFTTRTPPDEIARAEEILEKIALTDRRHIIAADLAHGEKQWLEIGMVVATDADLLLLDEPTAGMGPTDTQRTAQLILSLLGRHAVLVIDHDMSFVEALNGYVTVLHQGQILKEGTVAEIRADPEVTAVYLEDPKMPNLLTLEKVSSAYGQSKVLWDVDMDIEQGSAVALIGRNGVGKTTLLNTIVGVQKLTSGKIIFADQDVSAAPAHGRARAGIGYVPQGPPCFSAAQRDGKLTVGLAALTGRGTLKTSGIGDYIFDLFPKLTQIRTRKAGLLSGGEQQQLAIGRALAGQPKLLLLDEPTEGIQPSVVKQIEQALRRIRTELGVTIVIVEQYLDFAWSFADDYHIMQRGQIVRSGLTAKDSTAEIAHLVNI